ncbi:hypothetical protein HELRODRAFT_130721, partial [Helobdella robusta]|uniref:non-specific serine/threonine protein kinase n=1 Tax=Helobdella robusta TaxID=6412 RepID=T1EHU5_HELRO
EDQENVEEYCKGGYHCVRIGSMYNDQYRIVRKLGWGYFSTVWLCWDVKKKSYAALKVVKSAVEFSDAARDEIKLLKAILNADPSDRGRERIIRLFDSFEIYGPHGKHYCLATEVMGPNLLHLIVQSKYRGLPIANVKIIMYQVLDGLRYLHEKCKIIHTDLKPENILLVPQPRFVWYAAAKIFTTMNDPASVSACEWIPYIQTLKYFLLCKQKLNNKSIYADRLVDSDDMTVLEKLNTLHHIINHPPCLTGDSQFNNNNNNNNILSSVGRVPRHDLSSRIDLVRIYCPFETQMTIIRHDAVLAQNDMLFNGKDPCRDDCPIMVKIADLGNACWTDHHYADAIQTLQYRCVETIIGAEYSTPCDLWSVACMAFELATGDFLFYPHACENFTRSQHHLALFVQLLGDIPYYFAKTGKQYSKYFNKKKQMRCPVENRTTIFRLLVKKYKWSREEASCFTQFLLPLLVYDPEKRASASQMLHHSWFS